MNNKPGERAFLLYFAQDYDPETGQLLPAPLPDLIVADHFYIKENWAFFTIGREYEQTRLVGSCPANRLQVVIEQPLPDDAQAEFEKWQAESLSRKTP